jgi:hypothetical protein
MQEKSLFNLRGRNPVLSLLLVLVMAFAVLGITPGTAYADGEPAAPTASVPEGNYTSIQTVGLSAPAEPGIQVFYTLDGSEPNTASTAYTGPIKISSSLTLKAITVLSDKQSDVLTQTYILERNGAPAVFVESGVELDSALENSETGTTIVLVADIDAVSSATYSSATASRPRVLAIEGDGHVLDGKGVNKTALRFRGDNPASFTFRNLTFQNLVSDLRYGGGAIGVYHGSVIIENCSFLNNESTNASGDGGAVLQDSASGSTTTITNSTFFGNTAGGFGGAIASAAPSVITNSTVVNNRSLRSGNGGGGGVYANTASGTVLRNSIVVGNTALASLNVHNLNTTDSTNNVIDDAQYANWLAAAPAQNGAAIPTLALLPTVGSPALDAAEETLAPATDQRGVARFGLPDIGSYELQAEEVASVAIAGQITAITGKTVEYTISSTKLVNISTLALDLAHSNNLELVSATASNAAFNATVLPGENDQPDTLLLWSSTGPASFADGDTVVTVVFNAIAPGTASVTLVGADAANPHADFLVNLPTGSAATVNTSIFDAYDFNRDGRVSLADLSYAQGFYRAAGDDLSLAVSLGIDVNEDGEIDLADFILILPHVR